MTLLRDALLCARPLAAQDNHCKTTAVWQSRVLMRGHWPRTARVLVINVSAIAVLTQVGQFACLRVLDKQR